MTGEFAVHDVTAVLDSPERLPELDFRDVQEGVEARAKTADRLDVLGPDVEVLPASGALRQLPLKQLGDPCQST